MLSHTSPNCKYHVVFTSKFKQKAFFGGTLRKVLDMLRGSANGDKSIFSKPSFAFDHVHTILEILPEVSFNSNTATENSGSEDARQAYCPAGVSVVFYELKRIGCDIL